MKKITLFLVTMALVSFHCSQNKILGKTVVTVDNKKITGEDLEFLGNMNPTVRAQLNSPFGRKKILDSLIEQQLLYEASRKEGLQKKDPVKKKINLYERAIVAQAIVDSTLEKEAKKYYEENKGEFERLKMSHIMIEYGAGKKGEKEALSLAQNIRARLDKGEKFEELAKTESNDPFTKSRGGDLGYVAKQDPRTERRGFGSLVEKAFELKVGEIAGPIKTDKGYHIILVTQPSEMLLYEEAQDSIKIKIHQQVRQNLLATLKKKAKIEFLDPQDAQALPEPPHVHPEGEMQHPPHDPAHEGDNH